jgi:hypothetical protein
MNALRELDFDNFEGPLMEFLQAYRKETEAKKSSKPKKGQSSADDVEEDGDGDGDADEEENGNNTSAVSAANTEEMQSGEEE